MTVKEAKKLISVCLATFPNFNPLDADLMAKVWADALEGYTYEQMNVALKTYIRTETKGFAPTPGQLIEAMQSYSKQELIGSEAWAMVAKAIRNGAYHAEEEYQALPPAVRRAVGSADQLHSWAIDEDFNAGVIQSHFLRSYQTVIDREKLEDKLPQSVRMIAQQTAKKLESKGGIHEQITGGKK